MNETQSFTESVTSLSETISNLGVLVVIAAVFIVGAAVLVSVLLNQAKRQSKHIEDSEKSSMSRMLEENREYMRQMIEQNNELVKTLMERRTDQAQRETPQNIVIKDKAVEQTLSDGRQRCDAERADVFLFTNGTHSFNHRKSFLKYMLSYSAKKSGAKLDPLKEGPTSLFPTLFDTLMKEKMIQVNDSKEYHSEDIMVPGWLSESAGAHLLGILKENEDPIGFVVCSYREPQDLASHTKEFHDLSVKLSVLLQYEAYKE